MQNKTDTTDAYSECWRDTADPIVLRLCSHISQHEKQNMFARIKRYNKLEKPYFMQLEGV